MADMNDNRRLFAVLFRFCRQLTSGGFLSLKESEFVKDMIIKRDSDMLEVAAVITNPNTIDLDDLKKLYGFFKHKVSLFIEKTLNSIYTSTSLDSAYAIAGDDTRLMGISDDASQVLIYGEVDYNSFSEVLRTTVKGMDKCHKFVDLGHGTGKAVIMVRGHFTGIC